MQYGARRLRSEPIMLGLAFTDSGLSKAWRQLLESDRGTRLPLDGLPPEELLLLAVANGHPDRKSTRLNSSHQIISYAVFCLKKKKHVKSQLSRALSFTHSTATPSHAHGCQYLLD